MTRTKLYSAVLLLLTPPLAFAQQASDPNSTETKTEAAQQDTCRVVESATPDDKGVYRAVLECVRPNNTTANGATLVVQPAATTAVPTAGGAPADTDGVAYFSSNGAMHDLH